ncbi:MAG TPA: PAS domain S-box protein [Planctomycetaceae bacterium]
METEIIRVLQVEDEPADAEFVRRALTAGTGARFELCCAGHFSEILKPLQSGLFDVLLLDLGLPEFSGLEALQEARRQNAEIPIVVLTGLHDEKMALESLDQGAQDYLVKGQLTADALQRSIRYAVQRQQLLAAKIERNLELEARARLAAIVEFSDDAIISETMDGRIATWNRAAERMYGYSSEEVLGRTVTFLLPVNLIEQFDQIRTAVRGGRPFRDFDSEFIRKDGQRIAISLSISPINDHEGKVIGISKIARDISERKRVEQALRDSQERFELAVRGSSDGLGDWYLDTGIATWSPRMREMLGYTKLEFEDNFSAVSSRIHPEDRERVLADIAESVRLHQMTKCDFRMLTKSGAYLWVQGRGRAVYDESDRPYRFAGSLTDISERKQAEQENQRLSSDRNRLLRRLQLQIARMPLAYILFDADLCVIDWNPAAERIFQYRREEVLGMQPPFEKIIPKSFALQGEALLQRIRNGDMSAHSTNENLTKDGRIITCEWLNTPLHSEDGEFDGLLCLAQDITDRNQMALELAQRNEQLRQSQKLEAVGSLAGGIAHEFNNLLQAIRGYAKYAMEGLSPDEQRHQDLEQVIKAGDRAAALTKQLLGFSRSQVLERTSFDHRELLTDLTKLLRPLIGEQIELEVLMSQDFLVVRADRGLLHQMLLNLCINARDAMPNGGRLVVKTERVQLSEKYCELHPAVKPGSYIVFSVADTGCGMSPDVKERIFEPFFTTKEVGKGTGLGLAMVYGCVQQHGGVINVYSEVGLGTTFRIYLPITADDDSVTYLETPAPSAGGVETILVAEDEPMVRDLAERILTKAGYSVLIAADGAEAVDQLAANADVVSLALLDAVMPKLTGREVYDRIKLTNPDLPVVFCSGYDPETGSVKSLMTDGLRLVQKPYDPEVLLRIVREALDACTAVEAASCIT